MKMVGQEPEEFAVGLPFFRRRKDLDFVLSGGDLFDTLPSSPRFDPDQERSLHTVEQAARPGPDSIQELLVFDKELFELLFGDGVTVDIK